MALRGFLNLWLCSILAGCISSELRMPSSVGEVYSNSQMKQSLMMAAQNKILFHLPAETIAEVEKTEIDNRCREFQAPFWAEKLSMYLNIFRSHPEYFSKINVIEIKKGDSASVQIQKDMDQVAVLKIQYVKSESRGKVIQTTNIPCQGSLAGYIGREIVKTEFELPSVAEVQLQLQSAPEKADSKRFSFSPDFLIYLAERGILFKFSHEQSFEKLPNGDFVMVKLLNQYAKEVHELSTTPASKSHLNLWIKKINQNSKQAELIQFFSIENDQQLKTGIKVDGEKEISKKNTGSMDLTYLFVSYAIENDQLQSSTLSNLDQCLKKMTTEMNSTFLRTPSSESEKSSYLHPGYSCNSTNP